MNKARLLMRVLNTQFSLNYELKDSVINPVDADRAFCSLYRTNEIA